MEPRGKLIRPKKSNVQLMFNTHDPLEEIHRAERAQEDDYFRSSIKNCLWRSAKRAPQKSSRSFGNILVCAAQSVASL